MKLSRTLFSLLIIIFSSTLHAGTIAVTEFLSNPDGQDSGREFIELYNYSNSPIDLTGYTITDEGTDSLTMSGITIGAGDFVILVNTGGDMSEAQAKAVFETAWLGGAADARVFGANFGSLSNSEDEIIVTDSGSTVVWSLAYGNDEDEDSTALIDDTFGTTTFGTSAAPGIVRSGDDNGTAGYLGYEDSGGFATVWFEDIAAIDNSAFLTTLGLDGAFYDGISRSEADPLMLTSAVPEPAVPALSLLAILLPFWRRGASF
ncbi:MAG: lamin tail domain-containing protein [Planctomycetales bacterium]|nr:lamin tail domain-containing protein [Planctomycetales bacterium]